MDILTTLRTEREAYDAQQLPLPCVPKWGFRLASKLTANGLQAVAHSDGTITVGADVVVAEWRAVESYIRSHRAA